MSVKIIDFVERESSENGKFFSLIVMGGPEVITSKETGKAYITARRASIPCTFDGETCKGLVGSSLPGQIQRIESEEYEYTIPETGETLQLNYSYEYVAEATTEDVVFESEIEQPVLI